MVSRTEMFYYFAIRTLVDNFKIYQQRCCFCNKGGGYYAKRKETSFTFRSHVWDRGKSVGITVRFLLGAWIIILFVVSSW